jgi:hypothetical protein
MALFAGLAGLTQAAGPALSAQPSFSSSTATTSGAVISGGQGLQVDAKAVAIVGLVLLAFVLLPRKRKRSRRSSKK